MTSMSRLPTRCSSVQISVAQDTFQIPQHHVSPLSELCQQTPSGTLCLSQSITIQCSSASSGSQLQQPTVGSQSTAPGLHGQSTIQEPEDNLDILFAYSCKEVSSYCSFYHAQSLPCIRNQAQPKPPQSSQSSASTMPLHYRLLYC